MIKAILLDFDGTLVTRDQLSVLGSLAGKERESEELNQAFHAGRLSGIAALVTRINFLTGLPLNALEEQLRSAEYLMPGAEELLKYIRGHGLISILHSGNIPPVLAYYQQRLGIDYIVGPDCGVENGIIAGVSDQMAPPDGFKLLWVQAKLKELGIAAAETLAIGDSPADIPIFQFAGHAIAINPKNNTAEYAQYTIHDDIAQAIPIIEKIRIEEEEHD